MAMAIAETSEINMNISPFINRLNHYEIKLYRSAEKIVKELWPKSIFLVRLRFARAPKESTCWGRGGGGGSASYRAQTYIK